MSYDVSLIGCYGCGNCSSCHARESQLDVNYTYNVSSMIKHACGSTPIDWNGIPAHAVAKIIRLGLKQMDENPSLYESMNPENGFGDFEGCKNFLNEIAEECENYPLAYLNCT